MKDVESQEEQKYWARMDRQETYKDVEDLKSLCSDLLKGMDKCSEAPYYIIQPFLSIIKKHKDTIKKYNID